MCGTFDSISDGLTGLSDAVGLKDVGDGITEGLGIRGVGDLLGDFDDALYDAGVRWDSVGQIAAVAATIYTGGVLAGAWGQGGWLAGQLGVGATAGATTTTAGLGSTAAAGAAAEGASLTGSALMTVGEQAALTAQGLAAQGMGESAIASAMSNAGWGSQVATMAAQDAAMGAVGSGAGMAFNTASAAPSWLSRIGSGIKSAGTSIADAVGSIGGGDAVVTDATGKVVTNTAAGGGFLSNPMVQYGLIQTGGNMISGLAQAQQQDEMYQRQLEADAARRARISTIANYNPSALYQGARSGIIANQMLGRTSTQGVGGTGV